MGELRERDVADDGGLRERHDVRGGVSRRTVLRAGLAAGSAAVAGRLGTPFRAAAQEATPGTPHVANGAAGARMQDYRIVYPDDAFAPGPEGLGVLNVQELFGAKGDGVTDDTEALIAAYDVVAEEARAGNNSLEAHGRILYFPNGVYRVTDTIVYSGDVFPGAGPAHEGLTGLRMLGESHDGVVIRLDDRAEGFGAGSEKPVVTFTKEPSTMNNSVAGNTFENMQIDVGSGNAGAIGLRFAGANQATVRNVTIRSSDPDLAGAIGLSLHIGSTQGYYKHITVEGFRYGIRARHPLESTLAMEYITARDQQVAGIRVDESSVSVRGLKSMNRVPAAVVTQEQGKLVMVDAELSGGSSANPAIDLQAGFVLVRNVSTSGYGAAIVREGEVVHKGPEVSEFATEILSLFGPQIPRSLDLPIEDTPEVGWEEDLSEWVSVNAYGAQGDGSTDDTAAIQEAMNAGKKVVYFRPGMYAIDDTVVIPAAVERVNFMSSRFSVGDSLGGSKDQGAFMITGESPTPLVVEDLFGWGEGNGAHRFFDHASTRTLVMRNVHAQRGPMYINTVPGGKVYMENVSNRSASGSADVFPNMFSFTGQQVWARHLNAEYGDPAVRNDGSALWVLGFKTEGEGTSFETLNGGKTELLGGVVNSFSSVPPEDRPVIKNHESNVSINLHTYGRGGEHFWKTLVEETRDGETGILRYTDAPFLGSEDDDSQTRSVLPLYVT